MRVVFAVIISRHIAVWEQLFVRLTVVAHAQLLLSLVLLMTSLVLGDGVLTPAQSGAAPAQVTIGLG